MTLDDLERSYDDAFHSAPWNTKSRKRAGIRAVVEALRDYISNRDDVIFSFNEILGSSEGAAGGSARKDEQKREADAGSAVVPQTPAAAPVCEWPRVPQWNNFRCGCNGSIARWFHNGPPIACGECCLPVKFTEAKP